MRLSSGRSGSAGRQLSRFPTAWAMPDRSSVIPLGFAAQVASVNAPAAGRVIKAIGGQRAVPEHSTRKRRHDLTEGAAAPDFAGGASRGQEVGEGVAPLALRPPFHATAVDDPCHSCSSDSFGLKPKSLAGIPITTNAWGGSSRRHHCLRALAAAGRHRPMIRSLRDRRVPAFRPARPTSPSAPRRSAGRSR